MRMVKQVAKPQTTVVESEIDVIAEDLIREIDSASDSTIINAAPEVANADLDRALAAARERGRRRVAEILSDSDMLSAENLARLLGQLKAEGVQVDDKSDDESNGRFAWVMDPEGHRIELWEPKSE